MLQHSVRSPKGYIEITEPEMPTIEGETLQCCHCGGHWTVRPGSGLERGFCFKCNQVHCGGPSCWECVPQEKVLENIEAACPSQEAILARLREFAGEAALQRQLDRLRP
jgi:hypothetical protein